MKFILRIALLMYTLVNFAQVQPDGDSVRETYTFSWAYDVSVTVNGQTLPMTFNIEPNADYYGFSMSIFSNAIEINDEANKLTIKTYGSGKAKLTTLKDKTKKLRSKYKYTLLPEKTLLGYHCIGIVAENENEEATIYFTNEAETTNLGLYKRLSLHHIVMQLAEYGFSEKSLILSSEVKLKNKPGIASVTCTRFEKEARIFHKADYTFVTE